ncbi:hypothetical protein A3SI_19691 [Nitritalea halalkaliphila LW7]|uniref:TonB-dependent receptor n=1 Tax=Nitritalea halalkaliphila LW7 TaxID=1189621 RepID=I5BSF9_9BACT|nr:hypothetical protein [Nitritalea halalkaliphila]EIM72511.1 hypothetical protein A3SI_19691 [Nitritalea halalkaliphila LW7]
MIQKVLINGRETSNAGAALITRTLSAEQIAQVEIRKREQSDKIKNSLLDTNDFMVLDITLKDEYTNRPFGKLRGTLGLQDQLEPGFFSNNMFVGEQVSFHAFLEHDRLGNEEISLMSVRNIGNEALAQLTALPADFQDFKSGSGFQRELFGFEDFIRKERTIGGVTSKIELSDNSSVFIGSYNVMGIGENARELQQIFFDEQPSSSLQLRNRSDFVTSKNKVEYRFDTDRVKFVSDVNFVFQDALNRTHALEAITDHAYTFTADTRQSEFYSNNRLEYFLVPKKWALSAKLGVASIHADQSFRSQHNDLLLRRAQGFQIPTDQTDLVQEVALRDRFFFGSLELYRKLAYGNLTGGMEFKRQELQMSKQAFDGDSSNGGELLPNSLFNLAPTTLGYQVFRPYLRHQYRFSNALTFTNKLRYAWYQLPESPTIVGDRGAFEVYSMLDFSGDIVDFTLTYQQSFEMFPLKKVIGGHDLLGFRSVGIPAQRIMEPQMQEVAEFNISFPIPFIGAQSMLAALAGRAFNGNFVSLDATPVVQTVYDQLESSYFLTELQLERPLLQDRMLLSQVNSFFINRQENAFSLEDNFFIDFNYFASELNLKFTPAKSKVAFDFINKFSRLDLLSELSPQTTDQTMFSTFANLKYVPSKGNWTAGPYVRRVWFLSGAEGTFTDVGGQFFISTADKKWVFRLIGYNLLNNREFVRQQALPVFFEIENERVFSRFVKLEVEYRF